jgi:uncharacterized membrane protein YuzA (DUF378 family)
MWSAQLDIRDRPTVIAVVGQATPAARIAHGIVGLGAVVGVGRIGRSGRQENRKHWPRVSTVA